MKKTKLCALLATAVAASALSFLPAAVRAEDKGLEVWCWDPAFNIYAMQEAQKIYQEKHPEFKLNIVETPWNDLQSKLNTNAASQQYDALPAIFLMQDNAFQKNVLSFPDVFEELDDSGINFKDFAAAKTNYSVVEGKHYGVPFDNGTTCGAWRIDKLKEAGVKLEELNDITWDQFIDIGKKVKEKTGLPMISMTSDPDLLMLMLQSEGASLFDKEGKPQIAGNDKIKEVIELHRKMIDAGVLQIVNDWDQYVGTITGGNVVGTINGCWILASIQTAKDQAGKWQITNIPKLSGKEATNYSNNGGSSWAVRKGSGKEKECKEFLKETFAGSKKLYETILPSSSAMATWLPMADSEVYAKPQAFFADQPVFKLLTDFAAKAPSNNTGIYYYEARDAVSNAMQQAINGENLDSALDTAQKTVEHLMSNK